MNPVYAGAAPPASAPDNAARARGNAMRRARRIRARSLRRRVIAGALALFVATWLMITLVLVTGHDPALAQRSSSAATTPAKATSTTTSPATTTTTSSSTSTTASSGSSGTTSVVTRQS